jgi:hypothetical protein
MTTTTRRDPVDSTSTIIESVRGAAEPALEAVRKFVDTVDGVFPDAGEDGPRRKVIDAAFSMAEKLVGLSTDFADRVVKATYERPGR